MPGHSRSKNGVASLAYVPGIHVFAVEPKDVDGRDEPGHDEVSGAMKRSQSFSAMHWKSLRLSSLQALSAVDLSKPAKRAR